MSGHRHQKQIDGPSADDDLHENQVPLAPWMMMLQSAGGAGNAFAGELLRSGAQSAPEATDSFLQGMRGGTRPVPFQAEMESAFGEDFSSVSCHLGQVDALNGLQANAAAWGEQIVFGEQNPDRALVAHELAHVVQQRKRGGSGPAVGEAGGASEAEAEHAARTVTSTGSAPTLRAHASGIHRDPHDPHPERVTAAIHRATQAADLAALDRIGAALHQAAAAAGEARSGAATRSGPRLATVCLEDQPVIVLEAELSDLLEDVETARATVLQRHLTCDAPEANRCDSPASSPAGGSTSQAPAAEAAIRPGTTYTFPEATPVSAQVFRVGAQGTARNLIGEYVTARGAYLQQLKDREKDAIDNFVMGQQFSTSADAEPDLLKAIIGSEAVGITDHVEAEISSRLQASFAISENIAGDLIGLVTRGIGAISAINEELERANVAAGSFDQRNFSASLRDHIEQQYAGRIMGVATSVDAYAQQFDQLGGTYTPATSERPAQYTGAKAAFLQSLRSATTELASLGAIPSASVFQLRFIERWISRFGTAQGGQITVECGAEREGDTYVFTLEQASLGGVANAARVADQLTRSMSGLNRRVYQLNVPVVIQLPGPGIAGGERIWSFLLDGRGAPDPSRGTTGFEPADAMWRAFCQQRTLDRVTNVTAS